MSQKLQKAGHCQQHIVEFSQNLYNWLKVFSIFYNLLQTSEALRYTIHPARDHYVKSRL